MTIAMQLHRIDFRVEHRSMDDLIYSPATITTPLGDMTSKVSMRKEKLSTRMHAALPSLAKSAMEATLLTSTVRPSRMPPPPRRSRVCSAWSSTVFSSTPPPAPST